MIIIWFPSAVMINPYSVINQISNKIHGKSMKDFNYFFLFNPIKYPAYSVFSQGSLFQFSGSESFHLLGFFKEDFEFIINFHILTVFRFHIKVFFMPSIYIKIFVRRRQQIFTLADIFFIL